MKSIPLLTFVALVVAFSSPTRSQEPPRKLNVLFIAVDDLNTSLGCYGHPLVKTPHIDRLAARGVRFDRAYCQYPVCNPSRTSLLSGMRPDTTGVLNNSTPPRTLLKDAVFLPEHFKANGYFTAGIGKIAHFATAVTWDVSESGGERVKGVRTAGPGKGAQKESGTADLTWKATDKKDEDEPDGRIARRVVQLLEEHEDQPFFIAAGFHKPHLPFIAPKKYFEMYPPAQIVLPKEPDDIRKRAPAIAYTHHAADDKLSDDEKKHAIAAYYACTSFTDAQVGVLLEAMDRLKLWENTVVVLWGDHGWHLGEHGGMWRKGSLFEESARAPFIWAVPGKKPAVSPALVEFVDIYPTLSQLCGLTPPKNLEGTSLAPLLDQPQRPWKKAAFTVVSRGNDTLGRTLRTARYRYTEWGDEKTAELYDHHADPREWNNLAGDSAQSEVVAQMRQLLKEGWKGARP